MSSRSFGVWLLALQAGCAGAVNWHTDQKLVPAGQDIVVHYRNASVYKAWGSFCSVQFERLCAGGWRVVPTREGERVCVLILLPISARQFDMRVHVDEDLPPGTYRVVTNVEVGGHGRRLETNPFEVTGAAAGARPDDACGPAAPDGSR